jgi:peptidoglycan hydrolase CwlO-like protein
MITIDDIEYTEDDLNDVSKAHVNRINELRGQATQLQMQVEELNVLISAYASAIRESVQEVKEA